MSEVKINDNHFAMNEYLDVNVKQNLVQLCSDCYHALGWRIINTSSGFDSVTLKLQRIRKIKNRVALCDLQRKCEDAFIAIEKLEKSKTTKAMVVSLGVGMVGTVFMACSVFAYLDLLKPLSYILAIPGFIGWGLPYFLYKILLKKNTLITNPMIERNYDLIYEACEKAIQLLN